MLVNWVGPVPILIRYLFVQFELSFFHCSRYVLFQHVYCALWEQGLFYFYEAVCEMILGYQPARVGCQVDVHSTGHAHISLEPKNVGDALD